MAGNASRDLLVKKGATALLGINSKSVSVNKSPIDVTTDEDSGFRTLLAEAGDKQLDVSFSGVAKDAVIRQLVMTDGSQLYTDITIEFPPTTGQSTGDVISGDFYLSNTNYTGGAPNGAIEFDGTLLSSGEWTFTVGTVAP